MFVRLVSLLLCTISVVLVNGQIFGPLSSKPGPVLDRIVVVARHGDRSPLCEYPWDTTKAGKKIWTQGYGQLTTNGKHRMYRLGTFLRHRLARNHEITPRDIYIRSSTVDRCLESAQLFAAGFVPPVSPDWKWSPVLGTIWQPVPIYTVAKDDDSLLVPSSPCPRACALYNRIPESERVGRFLAPYAEVLKQIENRTRVPIGSYRDVRDIFDSLLSLKHHIGEEDRFDLALYRAQSWCTAEQYETLKAIFEMSFRFDYTGSVEHELRRLRAGLLLTEIFSRLDPDNREVTAKLSYYSTHDSALFHLLDALGHCPARSPKFGATILFESYRSIELNQTLVRVSLIEAPGSLDVFKMKPLKFQDGNEWNKDAQFCAPQQEFWIPLAELRKRFGPLMIKDQAQWREECADLTGLNQK